MAEENTPEVEQVEKPSLFSNKKPVSSAIKKLAEKAKTSDDEPKQPSRFTRAEGDLKKTLGASKADMLVERTDRDKLVSIFERSQTPEEAEPVEAK